MANLYKNTMINNFIPSLSEEVNNPPFFEYQKMQEVLENIKQNRPLVTITLYDTLTNIQNIKRAILEIFNAGKDALSELFNLNENASEDIDFAKRQQNFQNLDYNITLLSLIQEPLGLNSNVLNNNGSNIYTFKDPSVPEYNDLMYINKGQINNDESLKDKAFIAINETQLNRIKEELENITSKEEQQQFYNSLETIYSTAAAQEENDDFNVYTKELLEQHRNNEQGLITALLNSIENIDQNYKDDIISGSDSRKIDDLSLNKTLKNNIQSFVDTKIGNTGNLIFLMDKSFDGTKNNNFALITTKENQQNPNNLNSDQKQFDFRNLFYPSQKTSISFKLICDRVNAIRWGGVSRGWNHAQDMFQYIKNSKVISLLGSNISKLVGGLGEIASWVNTGSLMGPTFDIDSGIKSGGLSLSFTCTFFNDDNTYLQNIELLYFISGRILSEINSNSGFLGNDVYVKPSGIFDVELNFPNNNNKSFVKLTHCTMKTSLTFSGVFIPKKSNKRNLKYPKIVTANVTLTSLDIPEIFIDEIEKKQNQETSDNAPKVIVTPNPDLISETTVGQKNEQQSKINFLENQNPETIENINQTPIYIPDKPIRYNIKDSEWDSFE